MVCITGYVRTVICKGWHGLSHALWVWLVPCRFLCFNTFGLLKEDWGQDLQLPHNWIYLLESNLVITVISIYTLKFVVNK